VTDYPKVSGKNRPQSRLENRLTFEEIRKANMRVAIAVLYSALAVLAVPAERSFAKTSDVPKTSDELSSSPCHAYEQSPDGSWKQLPCQEDGLKAQPASKVSTRDVGKTTEPGKATR
jgi:hypothetical protein